MQRSGEEERSLQFEEEAASLSSPRPRCGWWRLSSGSHPPPPSPPPPRPSPPPHSPSPRAAKSFNKVLPTARAAGVKRQVMRFINGARKGAPVWKTWEDCLIALKCTNGLALQAQ